MNKKEQTPTHPESPHDDTAFVTGVRIVVVTYRGKKMRSFISWLSKSRDIIFPICQHNNQT